MPIKTSKSKNANSVNSIKTAKNHIAKSHYMKSEENKRRTQIKTEKPHNDYVVEEKRDHTKQIETGKSENSNSNNIRTARKTEEKGRSRTLEGNSSSKELNKGLKKSEEPTSSNFRESTQSTSGQIKTVKQSQISQTKIQTSKETNKFSEKIEMVKEKKPISITRNTRKPIVKGKNTSSKYTILKGTINTTFEKLRNTNDNNTDTGTDALYTARDNVITGKKAIRSTMQSIKTAKKIYKLSKKTPKLISGTDVKGILAKNLKRTVGKNLLKANKTQGVINTTKEKAWATLSSGQDEVTDTGTDALYTAREYIEKGTDVVRGTTQTVKTGHKIYKKSKEIVLRKKAVRIQSKIMTAPKNIPKQSRNIKTRIEIARNLFVKREKNKVKTAAVNKAYKLIQETSKALGRGIVKLIASNPYMAGGVAIALVLFIMISSASGSIAGAAMPMNFILAEEQTIISYKDKIESLDKAFKQRIEDYKNDSSYDDIRVDIMNEIGTVTTNWQEILSIMAVEYEQELNFTSSEKRDIEDLFNEFNEIKTRTETYQVRKSKTKHWTDADGNSHSKTVYYWVDKRRLIVEVYSYGLEDVMPSLGFEEWQEDWTRRLVTSDLSQQFPEVAGLSGEAFSREEIAEFIQNAPNSSATREEIIQTALGVVGRVGYFWGGKSSAGWNDHWGELRIVTAPGSKNTGKLISYGLDCSGYVDWVYKTAGVGNILSGGGTAYQWGKSYPIGENELKPGDLVFKNTPQTSGVNHVGVYVGKDNEGNKLFAHCAGGQGVVVNSYKGFKYWRRPFMNFGS